MGPFAKRKLDKLLTIYEEVYWDFLESTAGRWISGQNGKIPLPIFVRFHGGAAGHAERAIRKEGAVTDSTSLGQSMFGYAFLKYRGSIESANWKSWSLQDGSKMLWDEQTRILRQVIDEDWLAKQERIQELGRKFGWEDINCPGPLSTGETLDQEWGGKIGNSEHPFVAIKAQVGDDGGVCVFAGDLLLGSLNGYPTEIENVLMAIEKSPSNFIDGYATVRYLRTFKKWFLFVKFK